MPLHIFSKGHRVNTKGFLVVMKAFVKPWMEQNSLKSAQDSTPAYNIMKTKDWLKENLLGVW
jgi:hypothetical protein